VHESFFPDNRFATTMMRCPLAVAFLLALLAARPAGAADSQPYFLSIKNEKTFMREGPGENHRIKWIYHRKGLPVEVIASFEVWRRVRDMDGEIGWIHMALLSRERMAVVTGAGETAVYGRADEKTDIVAEAKSGAVGRLKRCGPLSCEVKFDGAEGWVERAHLWGVHDGEQF
jgi:SH3-like domain-containing protein